MKKVKFVAILIIGATMFVSCQKNLDEVKPDTLPAKTESIKDTVINNRLMRSRITTVAVKSGESKRANAFSKAEALKEFKKNFEIVPGRPIPVRPIRPIRPIRPLVPLSICPVDYNAYVALLGGTSFQSRAVLFYDGTIWTAGVEYVKLDLLITNEDPQYSSSIARTKLYQTYNTGWGYDATYGQDVWTLGCSTDAGIPPFTQIQLASGTTVNANTSFTGVLSRQSEVIAAVLL